jgi:ribosomal protein S18 acetylase RimI-like enzyme
MAQVSIETLQAMDVPQAAKVAARAFSTNPLSVAVYREQTDKLRQMQASFTHLLETVPGEVYVAKKGNEVVGMLRFIEWPHCQVSFIETLINLPPMLIRLRGMALRTFKARYIWLKHHPGEPHWHLGPVAVAPEEQGQGIGTQLLERFCNHVDRTGQPAYLETDKPENVRLYQRFGFSVKGEALVLGERNWFMWRPRRDAHQ